MAKKTRKGILFEDLQTQRPIKPQKKKPKSWEDFELEFPDLKFFKSLQTLPSIKIKKMFGGLSIYKAQRLLLFLCQSNEDYLWKGKKYDFPLWNGLLIATDRKNHSELQKLFPKSFPHPVLGKWLMIRRGDAKFNSSCKTLVQLIQLKSSLVGVTAKKRKKSKPQKA